MSGLVHTLAMAAALAAVCAGLWQDWGLPTTVRKMVTAYLATYVLLSLAVLAVRAAARPAPPQPQAGGAAARPPEPKK